MTNDPLQNELDRLKPLPLSGGFMPRFEEAIEAQLAKPPLAAPWRRRIVIALTAAACIALAIISVYRILAIHSSQPNTAPDVVYADAKPFPTVAQYQRAYMESPAELEALLQQRPANAPEQPLVRAGDVMHFNPN